MTENKESYPDSFRSWTWWLELRASLPRNPWRKWPVLACWPQVTSYHHPAFVRLCFPKLRSPWTCVKCSPCHNWNAVLFLKLHPPHLLPGSKKRKSVPWARSSLKLPRWDSRPCREAAYFPNLPLLSSPSFRPVSFFDSWSLPCFFFPHFISQSLFFPTGIIWLWAPRFAGLGSWAVSGILWMPLASSSVRDCRLQEEREGPFQSFQWGKERGLTLCTEMSSLSFLKLSTLHYGPFPSNNS